MNWSEVLMHTKIGGDKEVKLVPGGLGAITLLTIIRKLSSIINLAIYCISSPFNLLAPRDFPMAALGDPGGNRFKPIQTPHAPWQGHM